MAIVTPKQVILDFDGVFVRNANPYIGAEVEHAVRVVRRLEEAGHILILVTMRQDELLVEAHQWLDSKGISVDYVNVNPMYETGSRKIYSHLIIDDHCLGIPLIRHPQDVSKKPFVDWLACEKLLEEQGYL